MQRISLVVCILVALACGGTGSVTSSPAPSGPMARMAARFTSFDCSAGTKDPNRVWCPVAAAGHGPFTPPDKTAIRIGLTLALPAGKDPADVVLANTSLAALIIGKDGAKITALTASNDAERKELAMVTASVAAALKGLGSPVTVKPDLESYLEQHATSLHPLALDADGGKFQGSALLATIERVEGAPWGAAWVVMEPAGKGTYVSVFPDSDLQVTAQ